VKNVLAVDGPARGKVLPVERPSFRYPDGRRRVSYYVHRYRLMGWQIWIASIWMDSEDISQTDMLHAILSDRAREACYGLNSGTKIRTV
jgi:hypothetical protein